MKRADPYYQSPAWQDLRLRVIRAAKWRCADCGRLCRGRRHGEPSPHVDHIVNRKQGGSDGMHNLRLLCQPCHNRKTHWEDRNTRDPIGLDGFPEGKGWGGG